MDRCLLQAALEFQSSPVIIPLGLRLKDEMEVEVRKWSLALPLLVGPQLCCSAGI